MTYRDDLRATRRLVATPEKWAKGALLRTRDGRFTLPGALWEVGNRSGLPTLYPLLYDMVEAHVPDGFRPKPHERLLASFEDHETTDHAAMIALLDRAIAAA